MVIVSLNFFDNLGGLIIDFVRLLKYLVIFSKSFIFGFNF